MTAIIENSIPQQAFEIIRDKIALILGEELASQATKLGTTDYNPTIFVERTVTIDDTELPVINVCVASGSYDNEHVGQSDGTYSYSIDIYASAKSTSSEDGDKLAGIKLHRIIGLVRAILKDKKYRTLGFDNPFIKRVTVVNFDIADNIIRKDTMNAIMGRVEFRVEVPEEVEELTPNQIDSYSTQVKLALTEKGYVYSGENIPIPPSYGGNVTINSVFINTVEEGDTLNINVVDTNGDPVGEKVGDAWVVPAEGSSDPATAVLKDTAGNVLSTTNIDPGDSADIEAPDATANLKDSGGGAISSTTIKSNESKDIEAPDALANLVDQYGTPISSTPIKSNETKQIIAPSAHVKNSDESYQSLILSDDILVLPDVDLVVNTEDAIELASAIEPSVKDKTFTILNSDMYAALPIAYNYPMPTGQTASYRTGDDGYNYANTWDAVFSATRVGRRPQLTDFTTLLANNAFGNTNRFTDDAGGQTYSNDLVIDHFTGLMWYRILASGSWNSAIDAAVASTLGGYSNWELPNLEQQMSILDYKNSRPLNYSPFNLGSGSSEVFMQNSTTYPAATTVGGGIAISSATAVLIGRGTSAFKTDSGSYQQYLICRKHY